ncbi:MAG: hypothetical protein ABI585_08985 [Betaproteobacteria bacterium]
MRASALAVFTVAAALISALASAAPSTECTKIGICYCVNDEHKATITQRVDRFRSVIAEQRKAGKSVGYLSVPLTSAGGGNFDINKEVAEKAKQAIEARYGADYVYVLNPGVPEADLPRNAGGADYMLMWTTLLEGDDGLGNDFDFVYFAGPQDFARYFGFDGVNDGAKLDAFYDARVKSNPAFAKAAEGGLTKPVFRRYYAFRASSTVSRGAHDEWNIFRMVNEKRRADPKIGAPGQIPVLFDGRGVNPSDHEAAVSEGYVGRCKL